MAATVDETYLPDDCWECIFKIFLNECGDHNRCLPSLSVFSKQFLSITDRFQFSLTIFEQTLPFLPRLLQRFTNLTSLDLKHITRGRDALLIQISSFPLQVKSLNLSNHPTIPTNGLQVFSQKITTLTSLICSKIGFIRKSDLYLIAEGFPLLEELDLSLPKYIDFYDDFDINATITLALPKLRKVNLSGNPSGNNYIYDSSLFHLCRNCEFLEEVVMFNCKNLQMEHTDIGIFEFSSSTDFAQMEMKSLYLAYNGFLNDETIKWFASIFPNLQLLDVNFCSCISGEGIVEVLRCCKIVHLNLRYCEKVNLHGLNFQVPTLEVLNLSFTRIDDKTLDAISMSCPGLLQLDLKGCHHVTNKGVKQVIENCT